MTKEVVLKIAVTPIPNGYHAEAEDMKLFWSEGVTIDATINKFKEEYADLLKIQFKQTLKFDFAVKLAA